MPDNHNDDFGQSLGYRITTEPQEGRSSGQSGLSVAGSDFIGAADVTTPTDIWGLIKQILIDMGLWGVFQSAYTMIFVIIIVFILLSYFKPR